MDPIDLFSANFENVTATVYMMEDDRKLVVIMCYCRHSGVGFAMVQLPAIDNLENAITAAANIVENTTSFGQYEKLMARNAVQRLLTQVQRWTLNRTNVD